MLPVQQPATTVERVPAGAVRQVVGAAYFTVGPSGRYVATTDVTDTALAELAPGLVTLATAPATGFRPARRYGVGRVII